MNPEILLKTKHFYNKLGNRDEYSKEFYIYNTCFHI